MGFYDELAAEANSLLAEFGQTVTLRKVAIGAYAPSTGVGAITNTDHSGPGVMLNYKQRDINGESVMAGDMRMLLSAKCTSGAAMPQPATGDQVIVGATTYTVQPSAASTNPAGTAVMYDLQLRGVTP